MSGGRNLTSHQQQIVKRYYRNKQTIMLDKLSHIVSELYGCTDDKKCTRLWKSARTALAQAEIDPARIERIVSQRSIEALAKVVTELS